MIVVQDTETKRRLGEIYAREWAVYVDFNMENAKNAPQDVKDRMAAGLAVGTALAENLHEVPVVVMFVFDSRLIYVTDDKLNRTPVFLTLTDGSVVTFHTSPSAATSSAPDSTMMSPAFTMRSMID